jgi:DnaJ family protein C protein 28
MDFVDWRQLPEQTVQAADAARAKAKANRYHGKAYRDYIEEQIHDAQERGLFDNLPGTGKPLKLDENVYAGDRALGYHLLKNNGYAPKEIELIKEIRQTRERLEAKRAKLVQRSKTLRSRRVPPFPSERRAFNYAVEQFATEYEAGLRELNRKILTLNVAAPAPMHQPLLEVEQLMQQFRAACPLFAVHTQQ